jgi:biotin-dependent carboxylase-like uncharacterized protein
MLATIQDLGRTGYAHLGVPRSGAADRRSLQLANRLVGNEETAACLELTFGGAALRFLRSTIFAITGAPTPARLSGITVGTDQWFSAERDEVLQVGVPTHGVRTYIAVGGGLEIPLTMGSRSCDTLSGLGPPPLRTGQRLSVGPRRVSPPDSPDCVTSPVPCGPSVEVRYRRGPRDDWFDAAMFDLFQAARWTLSTESNRVGARLIGPAITVNRDGQLPSEGMVLGSIEIPPSGQPIVFLADHPTTGGYPVIGVVEEDDVAVLAQTRPGATVQFVHHRTARSSSR